MHPGVLPRLSAISAVHGGFLPRLGPPSACPPAPRRVPRLLPRYSGGLAAVLGWRRSSGRRMLVGDMIAMARYLVLVAAVFVARGARDVQGRFAG
jgi:hypothetical protein